MKVLDIQHEYNHDHDTLCILIDKADRGKIKDFLSTFNLQSGKEYDIKVTRHREKRSLDANSYYWLLIGKIASVLGASKTEIHNQELSKYGVPLTDKDEKVLYCLYKESIDYMNNEQIHLKPTGKTEDRNGVTYMWFQVMKPTHEMDSKEFSDLLDGVISDCKDLQIQTLSPDEIARMKAMGVE